MANTIDVIFNGVDKVSGVVNKITSANEGNAKSLLAMVGGWAAVGAAAYKAADYIADSVQSTVDYGKAVRDMARITGDSVEETSRLIQVSDDLVISQEELAAAMRGAVQKGVDTSIDGLARLADEYLKLDEGLERSEFLVDNFGRTGLKMGAMMEKGGDGIRAMADSIDDSLIMTQEAVDAAREYEIAVDNLNDAFEGLKVKIGNEVIPVLTDVINIWTDPSIRSEGFNRMFGESTPVIKELTDALENNKDELSDNEDEWEEYRSRVTRAAQKTATEVVEEFTALDEAIQKQRDNLSEAARDWTQKFSDQDLAMQELVTEQNNLILEKEKLIREGWLPESEAVQGVTTKMDENIQKIDDLMAKQDEERLNMLANIAVQGLDEDAKYKILTAMGLITDETGTMIDSILDAKSEFAKTGDLEKYKQKLDDIYSGMKKLDGMTAHMKVVLETQADVLQGYMEEGGPPMSKGGTFTVPPGYPNDSFPMRVESGEVVSVTPASEVGAGRPASGGAGVNVYLSYSPVVSLADRYEAETKLVPYIESALRKIR